MKLRVKTFIYRFLAIFNIEINIGKKETQEFLKTIENLPSDVKEKELGLWEARVGFSTILSENRWGRIKHAFNFKRF